MEEIKWIIWSVLGKMKGIV